MKIIGNFFGGVCAVLFVISGIVALLLFNIERKAFSSESYKQAFEDQNLYDRMPGVLAAALSTSMTEGRNTNPLLGMLSTEDWETSIGALLPPEELKSMTNKALDSIFDYLNGRSDSAVVSLTSLKGYLTSDAGVDAIVQLLRKKPDCTTEQLLQIALGVLGGNEIVFCNPPDDVMGLVTPMIGTQLQFITLSFPDEVTIISGEKSNTPDDPRIQITRVRKAMKLTLVFPILFLLAVTIFAVRSLKEWLAWWGWSFTFTGGISLLIALLGSSVIGFIIGLAMQNETYAFIPPILLTTMQETVREVARLILVPVAVEGLFLVLLGVGMAGVAIFLTRRKNAK